MSEAPASPPTLDETSPEGSPVPDHDGSYHGLFTHPAMVGSLLRTFVAEEFVADLSLDSMERVNVKYQAPGLARRQGDVVWRIPLLGADAGSVYLLVLLEFQSASERFMVLRLLVYAGLLWQQLVEERSRLVRGKLPPLFALVLHNGATPWTAPLALQELVALEADSRLWGWQPSMRYYLLDVATLAPTASKHPDELAAALVRLEHCQDPRALDAVVADVIDILERNLPSDLRLAGQLALERQRQRREPTNGRRDSWPIEGRRLRRSSQRSSTRGASRPTPNASTT